MADLVTFVEGDALELPFADSEFDATISEAMLVLVADKRRAVGEAIRVTWPAGWVAFNELSWAEPPSEVLLRGASEVLCAECMTKVDTFEGWRALLEDAGVEELETPAYPMHFGGMRGMVADEGFAGTCRVICGYLTGSAIRARLREMGAFFREHERYFAYGIYLGRGPGRGPSA